jgi:hypothetical protein
VVWPHQATGKLLLGDTRVYASKPIPEGAAASIGGEGLAARGNELERIRQFSGFDWL